MVSCEVNDVMNRRAGWRAQCGFVASSRFITINIHLKKCGFHTLDSNSEVALGVARERVLVHA